MRWGGSKARKAPTIVAKIPHDIRHYIEPFCGYCCVYRRVMAVFPHLASYTVRDKNADLIAWLRSVADGSHIVKLAEARKRLLPELAHADEIREEFELSKGRWLFEGDTFAWFFLHCYAVGQYVSRNRSNIGSFDPGYFNHGLKCETIPKAERFQRQLQRTTVECGDAVRYLRDLNKRANKGWFAYLDPPYIPADKSFDLYQEDFTVDEHRDLCKVLKRARFRFLLSIGDSPPAREIYLNGNGFLVRPMLYLYGGHAHKQWIQGRGHRFKTKEWLVGNFRYAS